MASPQLWRRTRCNLRHLHSHYQRLRAAVGKQASEAAWRKGPAYVAFERDVQNLYSLIGPLYGELQYFIKYKIGEWNKELKVLGRTQNLLSNLLQVVTSMAERKRKNRFKPKRG